MCRSSWVLSDAGSLRVTVGGVELEANLRGPARPELASSLVSLPVSIRAWRGATVKLLPGGSSLLLTLGTARATLRLRPVPSKPRRLPRCLRNLDLSRSGPWVVLGEGGLRIAVLRADLLPDVDLPEVPDPGVDALLSRLPEVPPVPLPASLPRTATVRLLGVELVHLAGFAFRADLVSLLLSRLPGSRAAVRGRTLVLSDRSGSPTLLLAPMLDAPDVIRERLGDLTGVVPPFPDLL